MRLNIRKGLRLTSVLLQEFSGVSNVAPPDCPFQILIGNDAYIHETLLGLK